jgi:hypothetical protein
MTVRECFIIEHVRKEVMSAWREDRKNTRGSGMYFRRTEIEFLWFCAYMGHPSSAVRLAPSLFTKFCVSWRFILTFIFMYVHFHTIRSVDLSKFCIK